MYRNTTICTHLCLWHPIVLDCMLPTPSNQGGTRFEIKIQFFIEYPIFGEVERTYLLSIFGGKCKHQESNRSVASSFLFGKANQLKVTQL